MKKSCFLLLALFIACSVSAEIEKENAVDLKDLTTDKLRPQFHYTARKGWINDPVGLFFYDGDLQIHSLRMTKLSSIWKK